MSIKPSSLKCNSCQEQNLETVTTALGNLERCPTCLSLWVEQKTLAAYSEDKVACRAALDETKGLLLPTERWCPKCYQKMVDGRVRSRGVILHLCQTCTAIWTDWDTLKKFDEPIERALHAQVDSAQQAPVTFREPSASGPTFPSSFRTSDDDTGMAKILRGLARTLDSMADGTSASPTPKPAAKPPKPSKPSKPEPAPKIKSEPVKPAKPVEKKPEPIPKPEPERKILKADPIPESPKPAPIPEPIIEKVAEPVVEPLKPETQPESEQKILKTDPIPETPLPSGERSVAAGDRVREDVEPNHPLPSPAAPDTTGVVDPRQTTGGSAGPVADLPSPEGRGAGASESPKPALIPEPIIEKVPEPVVEPAKPEPAPQILKADPIPETPLPSPEGRGAGTSEPVIEKKPAPVVKPGPKPVLPKPAAIPKPVKPKGPGLLSRLAGLLKPSPKPPKPIQPPVVKPVVPRKPVLPKSVLPIEKPLTETPLPAAVEPTPPQPSPVPPEDRQADPRQTSGGSAGSVADLSSPEGRGGSIPEPKPTPTPTPVPKPVSKPVSKPTPRPSVPRTPRTPSGVMMRALPMTLALIAFFANVARGYDFEWSFGILWAMLFWSIGFMVRLIRFYPGLKNATPSLKEIVTRTGLSPSKGYPVALTGVVELADPAKPKGPVVFVMEGERIALNRLFALDFVPRLFGISNPTQIFLGEVILKGWYRRLPVSFIDIAEVQSGKKSRKSMVRAMRWGCAILVAALATLILLTAE